MWGRVTTWAGAVVCLVAGAGAGAGKSAAREADASVALDPARRAALLASHGEPRLAWDALVANGGSPRDVDARLAVRLLTELGRAAQADSVLARDAAPKDDRAATWYYLRRARLNLEAGRAQRAIELLAAPRVPPSDPLAAYVAWARARAYLAVGDAALAAEALERVSAPEALAGALEEERARVLRALDRHAEALAAVERAIERVADADKRRELFALRFEVARDAGDATRVEGAALSLLDAYRRRPEAEACALELTRALRDAGAPPPSTRLLFACAEVFVARGTAGELRRVLRALDARDLKGRDAEYLRLLWAEYHYLTRDYSRAVALARPSYDDVAFRKRSTIVLARSFRGVGRKADAAAIYQLFVRNFPNDAMAADALYAAASLREQIGQTAESERLLDELRRSYPSSFHGWAAGMRRASDLQKSGQADAAAAIFEQWLARSRRTDEAALFYLSRLQESDRKTSGGNLLLDELRRVNPYSFYISPDVGAKARGPVRDAAGTFASDGAGSLAAWLADAAHEREGAFRRVSAAAEDQGGGGKAGASTREALDRGLRFLEAGFRDWAERELDVVRRSAGDSPEVALVLAKAYEEYAMPWRSVRLYERARVGLAWQTRREHADDFRYLMYPLPYPAQVFQAAAQNELPAHLIYAMIREESRFETDAVSRAGAIGLMQLMPGTARQVADRMDLGAEIEGRLVDPGVNVAIGTWYASDLLRAGNGSVAWMLAAYNAGPRAAKRWLAPGVGGEDAIAAVETIDYPETRGYVKRVVESANVYHALYFGEPGGPAGPR